MLQAPFPLSVDYPTLVHMLTYVLSTEYLCVCVCVCVCVRVCVGVQGAGAGAEITAAGIVSDIVALIRN